MSENQSGSAVKPVRLVLRPVGFDYSKWRIYLVGNGSNRFLGDNLNITENILLVYEKYEQKEAKMNSKMEHMIEQQIITLDMEALTNRMKRLELEDKVITLLNQLWDENWFSSN